MLARESREEIHNFLESRAEQVPVAALEKMRDTLWSDPRNGLEANFTGLADFAREAHELALRRALVAGAP